MFEQRKLNQSGRGPGGWKSVSLLAWRSATALLGAPGLLRSSQPAPQPAALPATASGQPPRQATESAEAGGPQTLHLLVGRSLVISSPARIKRVSLADPNIAEAIVVSPTQVLVNGQDAGRRFADHVGRSGPEPGLRSVRGHRRSGLEPEDSRSLPVRRRAHRDLQRRGDAVGRRSPRRSCRQDPRSGEEHHSQGHQPDASPHRAAGTNPAAGALRRSQPHGDQPARNQHSQSSGRQERWNDFDATVCSAATRQSTQNGTSELRDRPERFAQHFHLPAGHQPGGDDQSPAGTTTSCKFWRNRT